MRMGRRDTIIIAVLVNVALLAALFATATVVEENRATTVVANVPLAQTATTSTSVTEPPILIEPVKRGGVVVDEIDQALQEYALKQKVVVKREPQPLLTEETIGAGEEDNSSEVDLDNYVEITVKKGDILGKIAYAHQVTVEEIMSLNQLKNVKLKIGQRLKIPKKEPSIAIIEQKTTTNRVSQAVTPPVTTDPEYYIIKGGDNPWKIARRFHLKYEDLLLLNGLDEEKAKNLKIGQTIRIR